MISTIRPAPGGDGPFMVTSERNGSVTNATLGVATLLAAINQARDDQSADFVGPLSSTVITTIDSG